MTRRDNLKQDTSREKENVIEDHINDIGKIFPGRLVLAKKELAQLRNVSESTLNREKANGNGIPYKVQNGRIMYPVRSIAEWLADLTITLNL